MSREIKLPLAATMARSLRAGDAVELTGNVFTGRDQACSRLFQLIRKNEPLPVDLTGELIYFVGPSPARPGAVVGSAGPTTSSRMNEFIPALVAGGLRGMIGKGFVSNSVKAALHEHGGVYFGAIGGTGALLSECIEEAVVVAFPDLLSEAIHRFYFRRFPAIVLYDSHGGDLYARTYGESNED